MLKKLFIALMSNAHLFSIFILLLVLGAKGFSQEKKFGTLYPIDLNLSFENAISLQPIIDRAEEGDTILLSPGMYLGPISIEKDGIVLDGQGKCEINGLGKRSVITLKGEHIIVKNLQIANSGGSHDKIDCGVKIIGSHAIVKNCRIKECLFGVDIYQSDTNYILHNEITSLSRREKALKGDAIRLWWSKGNTIRGNYWHKVRDMVVWYSSGNLFEENLGIGNRYSIHFMYSHSNRIKRNEFYNNSVGVFLMYSEKTIMSNNLIVGSTGVSGMCLGMKETSSNQILNNRFIYSAEGIHIDVSPFVPEQINTIQGNEIAFCGSAIFFHTNQMGNIITKNNFHSNLANVTAEGKTANGNKWNDNFYDDYQGFDRNNDNIGDTPYELYAYVEHLWDFNKDIKFFYGSPLLVILDFLERLAPFSEPKFVLRDKSPKYLWEDNNNVK